MDQVAVGRRLAAARKRAGIKTRKDLADRVSLPRLGKETIGKIERGERPLYEHEAPFVARALEVPVSYFYEEETADAQLDRIEDKLDAIRDYLAATAPAVAAAAGDGVEQALAEARRRLLAADPRVQSKPRRTGSGSG